MARDAYNLVAEGDLFTCYVRDLSGLKLCPSILRHYLIRWELLKDFSPVVIGSHRWLRRLFGRYLPRASHRLPEKV